MSKGTEPPRVQTSDHRQANFAMLMSFSPCFQNYHYTATDDDLKKDLNDGLSPKIYNSDSSFYDHESRCRHPEQRPFVQVIHEGTPEFEPLADLVKAIPFQQMLDDYVEKLGTKKVDPNRGNFQVNYGFAGPQNQCRRTPLPTFGSILGQPSLISWRTPKGTPG